MENGEKSVVDGTKMTDEQLGKLTLKFDEIKRRINDGTIPYMEVVDTLQKVVIENKMRQYLEVSQGKAKIVYPVCKWREENGVIRFSLTSDGITGEQWITRLESQGIRVSDYAKSILRSKSFKPGKPTVYEIAVLKGGLFSDEERITKNIRAEGKKRKHLTPNAEVACLIREAFSDEDLKAMGLDWLATMHKPIKDFIGNPALLNAVRGGVDFCLLADYGCPVNEWRRGGGFAFVVSQVELRT